MAHTLKLRDTEVVIPGQALPEAFQSLEKRVESTLKLCKLSTPPDAQVLGVLAICQELQRLLKCAFIENGFLASRMEIFTRHHSESLKKMNKTVSDFDIEHKVTKKQIKRLRKKLSVMDTCQRKKNERWWDIEVRSTDYESFNILSSSSGSPDLEFMLRVNQVLIDFVRDEERTELFLPPMGQEERAEVSKLASIYKIRCRYGKSTHLASSTLMKARQTCIPGHGEVDAILDGFARSQNLKRLILGGEEGGGGVVDDTKHEVVVTATEDIPLGGKSKSPPVLTSIIPPTMLTPLSSLTSPTIDMSGIASASNTPSQSPPTSGLSTPTPDHVMKARRDSSSDKAAKNRSRCGSLSNESPVPLGSRGNKSSHSSRSSPSQSPNPASFSSAAATAPSGALSFRTEPLPPALSSLHMQSHGKPVPTAPSVVPQKSHVSLGLPPTTAPQVGGGPLSGILLQHHTSLRPMTQPTVVASPLKVPVSQLPHTVKHNLSIGGGMAKSPSMGGGGLPPEASVGEGGGGEGEAEGGGGKREALSQPAGMGVTQPPKRIRLTRKSAGIGSNEDS